MNKYQTQESDMQVKNCTKDFPIPNIPLPMTDTYVSKILHSSFFTYYYYTTQMKKFVSMLNIKTNGTYTSKWALKGLMVFERGTRWTFSFRLVLLRENITFSSYSW